MLGGGRSSQQPSNHKSQHPIHRPPSVPTQPFCRFGYSVPCITGATRHCQIGFMLHSFVQLRANVRTLSTLKVGQATVWCLVGLVCKMHFWFNDIFRLTMGLLGGNHISSWGREIYMVYIEKQQNLPPHSLQSLLSCYPENHFQLIWQFIILFLIIWLFYH